MREPLQCSCFDLYFWIFFLSECYCEYWWLWYSTGNEIWIPTWPPVGMCQYECPSSWEQVCTHYTQHVHKTYYNETEQKWWLRRIYVTGFCQKHIVGCSSLVPISCSLNRKYRPLVHSIAWHGWRWTEEDGQKIVPVDWQQISRIQVCRNSSHNMTYLNHHGDYVEKLFKVCYDHVKDNL
jgi:hypothetical protein